MLNSRISNIFFYPSTACNSSHSYQVTKRYTQVHCRPIVYSSDNHLFCPPKAAGTLMELRCVQVTWLFSLHEAIIVYKMTNEIKRNEYTLYNFSIIQFQCALVEVFFCRCCAKSTISRTMVTCPVLVDFTHGKTIMSGNSSLILYWQTVKEM